MTLIGYTMMCEQTGPKQLVRDVALTEEAGFEFAVDGDLVHGRALRSSRGTGTPYSSAS